MASPTTPAKRPRAKRPTAKPRAAQPPPPVPVVSDAREEAVGPNYALRLTEALEAISSAQNTAVSDPEPLAPPESSFAEVLEAISSDNDNRPAHRGMGNIQRKPEDTSPTETSPPAEPTGLTPRRRARSLNVVSSPEAIETIATLHPSPLAATVAITRPVQTPKRPEPDAEPDLDVDLDGPRPAFLVRVLRSLDTLPPIRLPLGPPIPWRFGAPALLILVVAMLLLSHSWSSPDAPSTLPPSPVPLPTPTVPLFSNPQPAVVDVSAPNPDPTLQPVAVPTAVPQPLGVQDPPGLGFDVVDVGLKLIAVLALAYGSLMLLKRAGIGSGPKTSRTGGAAAGVRVVASVALAPNRSVHVLKVPGGKTLVVGATPNQVNLIADLGELPDSDAAASDGSFFDLFKGRVTP